MICSFRSGRIAREYCSSVTCVRLLFGSHKCGIIVSSCYSPIHVGIASRRKATEFVFFYRTKLQGYVHVASRVMDMMVEHMVTCSY